MSTNNVITNEDLQKATAVRIFEKVAAINNNTTISSKESTVSNNQNIFSDDLIDAFEKQASAEGIDLNSMDDAALSDLYNHFIELVQQQAQPSQAEVDEAQEKLAEAEILGRHMARAFADEQSKIASAPSVGSRLRGQEQTKEAQYEEILQNEALRRAQAFLVENGIDPQSGEKVATAEEDQVVNDLALKMLRDAGYNV